MRRVDRLLCAHEELILNWFRAKGETSSGAVEGLNNKIRVVTRRSYGQQNPTGWGWACRFAARSSRRMMGSYGLCRINRKERCFNLPFRLTFQSVRACQ
jgi:Transposase